MVDSWLGEAIRKYLKENRYSQSFISEKTGIESVLNEFTKVSITFSKNEFYEVIK